MADTSPLIYIVGGLVVIYFAKQYMTPPPSVVQGPPLPPVGIDTEMNRLREFKRMNSLNTTTHVNSHHRNRHVNSHHDKVQENLGMFSWGHKKKKHVKKDKELPPTADQSFINTATSLW